jgi:hypothetical protein
MSLDDRELVFVATGEELERIAAFLRTLERVRSVRLVHRDGSPWIELDVVFGPEVRVPSTSSSITSSTRRRERFDLWRARCVDSVIREVERLRARLAAL